MGVLGLLFNFQLEKPRRVEMICALFFAHNRVIVTHKYKILIAVFI